jgi:hypothetical protein
MKNVLFKQFSHSSPVVDTKDDTKDAPRVATIFVNFRQKKHKTRQIWIRYQSPGER